MRSDNEEVKRLSEIQKKLKNDINACKNKTDREEKRKERNETLKQIECKLQEEEKKKVESKIEDLEKCKNDSTKMFKVIREISSEKRKQKVVVEGHTGLVTDEKMQSEIITDFFQNVFYNENEKQFPDVEPKEMRINFSAHEVEKAAKSLKRNKSPGCNDIKRRSQIWARETI